MENRNFDFSTESARFERKEADVRYFTVRGAGGNVRNEADAGQCCLVMKPSRWTISVQLPIGIVFLLWRAMGAAGGQRTGGFFPEDFHVNRGFPLPLQIWREWPVMKLMLPIL